MVTHHRLSAVDKRNDVMAGLWRTSTVRWREMRASGYRPDPQAGNLLERLSLSVNAGRRAGPRPI